MGQRKAIPLAVEECKIMFLKIYYEDTALLCICAKCVFVQYMHKLKPWGARGNVFLDVKGCLKFLGAVFRVFFVWEKSMLLASHVLSVFRRDWLVLDLGVVDGVENLG